MVLPSPTAVTFYRVGTSTYQKLDQLHRPVSSAGIWRIMPKRYIKRPLGMGFGYSRFAAPSEEFKVLYATPNFETALRESLIRDRYDQKKQRRIAEHTLRNHASAVIVTIEEILLLDLTDGGAHKVGVPSDIRHAKDYQKSQAFALEVYQQMPEVDGFLYRSRLDDQPCISVFDRAVTTKLHSPHQLSLASNPLTRPALKKMNISTFKWRGKA